MTLHAPFEISARLLPSLRIGEAWLSLKAAGVTDDHRVRFRWYFDLPDGTEFSEADLKSGVGGCGFQRAFADLLSFLGAAVESYQYEQRAGCDADPDGNTGLFPLPVVQWAAQHSDEIDCLACEIEETKNLIT